MIVLLVLTDEVVHSEMRYIQQCGDIYIYEVHTARYRSSCILLMKIPLVTVVI